MCLEKLGLKKYVNCVPILYVFRLFEDRHVVSITAVVGADDMFSVGLTNRCDILCDDVIVRSSRKPT